MKKSALPLAVTQGGFAFFPLARAAQNDAAKSVPAGTGKAPGTGNRT